MMRKSMIMIQYSHRYRSKNTWVPWIMAMNQTTILCLQRCYKIFVTEVSLVQMLIKDSPVFKYVIVLGKDNWNGKEH